MQAQSQTGIIALHPFGCLLTLLEVIHKDHRPMHFAQRIWGIIKRRRYEHSVF
jgi:hypothetical protein